MVPKGPFKLCTVNTVPERAKRLVGRVVEEVKEEYTILHVENAESTVLFHMPTFLSNNLPFGIEDVKAMCERNKPDVLFCASMWTKDESDEILRIAKETVPGIKTMAIPQGLQVEKGPDAVVEYLKEKWPGLVEG
ncbi:uncharacterized protein RCO7_04815 [Rhynchosporium graminicola]|uniref:Uncharacterized protein n=1 Tax=Rhynchosporium graminicola TaxID=2792576 RepID=A0A1E1KF40_9HELO|nr:uncharacterized protein RCO7_04815 [Rhynchosporium commune]